MKLSTNLNQIPIDIDEKFKFLKHSFPEAENYILETLSKKLEVVFITHQPVFIYYYVDDYGIGSTSCCSKYKHISEINSLDKLYCIHSIGGESIRGCFIEDKVGFKQKIRDNKLNILLHESI